VLAGPRDRFECDVVRASDTGPLPLRGLRRVRLPPPGRAASPLASGSIAKKAAEEAESAQQREALERQGRRSRRKGAARSARTQDRGRRSGKRLEGPMRGAVTQRCLACNRASAAAQGSLQARARNGGPRPSRRARRHEAEPEQREATRERTTRRRVARPACQARLKGLRAEIAMQALMSQPSDRSRRHVNALAWSWKGNPGAYRVPQIHPTATKCPLFWRPLRGRNPRFSERFRAFPDAPSLPGAERSIH